MFFRVPLLEPSAIVLHRLDTRGTRAVDPPGAATVGYDADMREPIPYEDAGDGSVKSTVRYLKPIRVPCQVEIKTFEEVRQQFMGDAPILNMIFVLHRKCLLKLDLLVVDQDCPRGGAPKIKTNDKITAVEKNGHEGYVTQPFKEPLYIVQVQPASWGMGPDGHDLLLAFVNNRPAMPAP